MTQKIWYTYDDIHRVVANIAQKIKQSNIQYDAMIAIGGGGFIPARMLRCFIDIPIYAISTFYYLSDKGEGMHDQIQKLQWLDPLPEKLIGKNILVVDEVDDSRVTMEFCLNELKKEPFNQLGFAALHNKIKPKKGIIPDNIHYYCGEDIPDYWVNYPWDAENIDEHNRLALEARQAQSHS